MSTIPDITVILCTYNQEKYVREAVRSILRQEGASSYEIIVADDGSTDRTLEIIRYELKGFQDAIFLPSDSNRGVSENYKRAFQACRGRYIAVLEGDDFWCSPTKLARQYELLEKHWECSLAISQTCVYFEQRGRNAIQPVLKQQTHLTYFKIEDLIKNNFTNFSGVMYRHKLIKDIPGKYYEMGAYDWLLHLWMAQFGLIGCVPEVQTVYRVHDKGLWSGLTHEKKLRAQLKAIAPYDAFFDFRFSKEFQQLKRNLRAELARLSSTPEKPASGAKGAIIKGLRKLYKNSPRGIVHLIKNILPSSARRRVIHALGTGR